MRPVQITPEALVVYDDVAAAIAPVLKRALDRLDRRQVDPDVLETIERLETMGDAYGVRRRNQKVSDVDDGGFEAVEWIPVKRYAQLEGISEQAATQRCREHLENEGRAVREGRCWRVAIPMEVA